VLPSLENPRVGLVYSNATLVGHPHGWTDMLRDWPYHLDPQHHPVDTFPEITNQCPIPTLTATARTHAIKAVGGYARWLRFCDDYYLWLKLAAKGWRFAFVNEHLANYRWPTEASGQSFDYRSRFRYLLKMWFVFALRHPRLPGPKRQVRVWTKRVANPDWWKS
jgi:hypothetical protein